VTLRRQIADLNFRVETLEARQDTKSVGRGSSTIPSRRQMNTTELPRDIRRGSQSHQTFDKRNDRDRQPRYDLARGEQLAGSTSSRQVARDNKERPSRLEAYEREVRHYYPDSQAKYSLFDRATARSGYAETIYSEGTRTQVRIDAFNGAKPSRSNRLF
jgi:hypothetical protein